MITHHKCFSTYSVICDSVMAVTLLYFCRGESRDSIQFSLFWNKQLVNSEKADFSILLSHLYPLCFPAPCKFLRCTNTILCRLIPQLWPWGLVFFQRAALMSSVLRTLYAHVSLMQPQCSWLSSLPRSSSLKPSFVKVSCEELITALEHLHQSH